MGWQPRASLSGTFRPSGWRDAPSLLNQLLNSSWPRMARSQPLHINSGYSTLTWRKLSFFSSACCLFLWRKSSSMPSMRRTQALKDFKSTGLGPCLRKQGVKRSKPSSKNMFLPRTASNSGEFPAARESRNEPSSQVQIW